MINATCKENKNFRGLVHSGFLYCDVHIFAIVELVALSGIIMTIRESKVHFVTSILYDWAGFCIEHCQRKTFKKHFIAVTDVLGYSLSFHYLF